MISWTDVPMNSISMVNLETGQQQDTVQRETLAGGPEILAGGDKFTQLRQFTQLRLTLRLLS